LIMIVTAADFVPNASPECTLFAKPSLPTRLDEDPWMTAFAALTSPGNDPKRIHSARNPRRSSPEWNRTR
jgi:hypothetical protein